jgi:hypothetical protein
MARAVFLRLISFHVERARSMQESCGDNSHTWSRRGIRGVLIIATVVVRRLKEIVEPNVWMFGNFEPSEVIT